MADEIVARDLVRSVFLRVGTDHTLRETLGVLLDPLARGQRPRVLIVLNTDCSFAGLLTTRDILRTLLPDWIDDTDPREENEDAFEPRLLDALRSRLDVKVVAAMKTDVSVAAPSDRLPTLLSTMLSQRVDSIPVLDGGRILGVVHLADVFSACARLALASQADV
ncbi:CBS domain-containing protein [Candidatus Sumerlaeota bacterium]|nr:CBS domain-containing protein [Candidatus Sumerlaeota bacterium]